ncbi:hypothetical protein N473_15710 [Pseudoalteromonas luteoviolacea CPMOR-1]|uniref:Uncharacterized protein n=1 Tax=Pseudoalteromonas luteoviolacea CPMOR-1 TaxID=1365248 RepID=A0A167L7R1_9GAMM|nr:hypothetical protein [Pseudoalteromonas luteoviolacea]KZN64046.1 hypothetical protein N473_15710 [Pseudoalteromonas luteoviolacea CPMOR-1]
MTNIKVLRKELRTWGEFWASKESTEGYARKSNVEKVKESCELGGIFSSTLYLHNQGADNIFIPPHIQRLTDRVERLSKDCKLAIVGKYVKGFNNKELKSWACFPEVKSVEFWILRAETELLQ